jgi:hypothetical protein
MVAVSQWKPKHVNRRDGLKEHFDVLRFKPTCFWSRSIAIAIPRASLVRSWWRMRRSSM